MTVKSVPLIKTACYAKWDSLSLEKVMKHNVFHVKNHAKHVEDRLQPVNNVLRVIHFKVLFAPVSLMSMLKSKQEPTIVLALLRTQQMSKEKLQILHKLTTIKLKLER